MGHHVVFHAYRFIAFMEPLLPQPRFARFLSTFPIDLLFGVVLGAIYFQLQLQRRASAR